MKRLTHWTAGGLLVTSPAWAPYLVAYAPGWVWLALGGVVLALLVYELVLALTTPEDDPEPLTRLDRLDRREGRTKWH